MHSSVTEWVAHRLPLIEGARVCEVGSYDVNGSVRPLVNVLKPSEYLGVDLRSGPGVDLVCDICSGMLASRRGQFDIVVSTETLEHVQSWQPLIREMKRLCRPGGHVLLTCRGPGFALHDYPGDYWRFTVETLREAFSDFTILDAVHDPASPGVFLHAQRPDDWPDAEPAPIAAVPVQ